MSLGTLETGILSQKFLKNPRAFRRPECQRNWEVIPALSEADTIWADAWLRDRGLRG